MLYILFGKLGLNCQNHALFSFVMHYTILPSNGSRYEPATELEDIKLMIKFVSYIWRATVSFVSCANWTFASNSVRIVSVCYVEIISINNLSRSPLSFWRLKNSGTNPMLRKGQTKAHMTPKSARQTIRKALFRFRSFASMLSRSLKLIASIKIWLTLR